MGVFSCSSYSFCNCSVSDKIYCKINISSGSLSVELFSSHRSLLSYSTIYRGCFSNEFIYKPIKNEPFFVEFAGDNYTLLFSTVNYTVLKSRYNIVSLFINNMRYVLLFALLMIYFYEKELNIERATLEYKILHYNGKSDGSISIITEIKFLLYFLVSFMLVRGNDRVFLSLCAIFYVVTFIHEFAHLRYHKYLYFVFMYMFLHSVRIQFSWFACVVALIGSYRMISVVKWL